MKSYSGYVNIPADPSEGRDYDTHTFFWFFEARKDPAHAPLSLWLQGGPGVPSMTAALGENGPCLVTEDSKDTVLNPWSWNNEVNMLYIDQPVQVGFSYDTLINGTIEETVNPFLVTPRNTTTMQSLELNSTFLAGTFASGNPSSTANTTLSAARTAWYFMQTWMQEYVAVFFCRVEYANNRRFPKYKPKGNKFSIWSESYGGHYGPTFADYFETQSQHIADGSIDKSAIPLRLETIGLVNACIDMMTQMPSYTEMAYNNTYGIQFINETQYQAYQNRWPACSQKIEACRSLAERDPEGMGAITEVNQACSNAFTYCFGTVYPYDTRTVSSLAWLDEDLFLTWIQHNPFDITAAAIGPFPPKYAAGYLNSKAVQTQLGVPLNFTGLSKAVNDSECQWYEAEYPTDGE